MTDTADRRLEVIDAVECRQLLRSRVVGRLGLNRRGCGPLVVPVNYVVDDTGAVVFRTDTGTKLARIARGAVSFQVDEIDEATSSGWSVLVEGLAHETDAGSEPAASVRPWSSGRMAHAVRIVPTTITGRRIRPSGHV